jgi:predicted dinucleotide-binding enzyme
MNIAILGTGRVAQAIGPRLLSAGHCVILGSRDADAPQLVDWAAQQRGDLRISTQEAAAKAGEVVVNAVPGAVAIDTLRSLDHAALAGKVLMDVSHAVTFGDDGFVKLMYPNGSVAEEIQKALPDTHVVKTLATMNTSVMEDPAALPSPTHVFVSGDSAAAKSEVNGVLEALGWRSESILDLGGLTTARGQEHAFLLLIALIRAVGTPRLNLAVVH